MSLAGPGGPGGPGGPVIEHDVLIPVALMEVAGECVEGLTRTGVHAMATLFLCGAL